MNPAVSPDTSYPYQKCDNSKVISPMITIPQIGSPQSTAVSTPERACVLKGLSIRISTLFHRDDDIKILSCKKSSS